MIPGFYQPVRRASPLTSAASSPRLSPRGSSAPSTPGRAGGAWAPNSSRNTESRRSSTAGPSWTRTSGTGRWRTNGSSTNTSRGLWQRIWKARRNTALTRNSRREAPSGSISPAWVEESWLSTTAPSTTRRSREGLFTRSSCSTITCLSSTRKQSFPATRQPAESPVPRFARRCAGSTRKITSHTKPSVLSVGFSTSEGLNGRFGGRMSSASIPSPRAALPRGGWTSWTQGSFLQMNSESRERRNFQPRASPSCLIRRERGSRGLPSRVDRREEGDPRSAGRSP